MTRALICLGMMSGTSLDGVDLALLKTNGETIEPLSHTKYYPYPPILYQKLQAILGSSKRTPQVQTVENQLTQYYFEALQDFSNTCYSLHKIDLIGIHGQTIFHKPRRNNHPAQTLQICRWDVLAEKLKKPIIGNFRQEDIKQGGEGAPLIPIYHKALQQYLQLGSPLLFLNIGGVSNITYLSNDHMLATDVGPGNAPINDLVHKKGFLYDAKGTLASLGCVHNAQCKQFLMQDFFKKPPPKSLDRNSFNWSFLSGPFVDQVATVSTLVVESIIAILPHLPIPPKKWILYGGGAHNTFIVKTLKKYVPTASVVTAKTLGLSEDFMEAQAFAYLAARCWYKRPITFPSTTGVSKPCIGGEIFDGS